MTTSQVHHILPTAVYNTHAIEIAKWKDAAGNSFNINAGYNRIILPTTLDGTGSGNTVPEHQGSHPGLNNAWNAIINNIINSGGTDTEKAMQFQAAHAYMKSTLDHGGTETAHKTYLNTTDPNFIALNPNTTLTEYMENTHTTAAVEASSFTKIIEAGYDPGTGTFGSANADYSNYSSGASYKTATGFVEIDVNGNRVFSDDTYSSTGMSGETVQARTSVSVDRATYDKSVFGANATDGSAAFRAETEAFQGDPSANPSQPGSAETDINDNTKGAINNAKGIGNSLKFIGHDQSSASVSNGIDAAVSAGHKVGSLLDGISNGTPIGEINAKFDQIRSYIEKIDSKVGQALDAIPGGRAIAGVGIVGDFVEISQGFNTAYNQAANGDIDGAVQTVIQTVSNVIVGNIAAYAGMAAAAAVGASAFPIVFAGFAAGAVATMIWEQFFQENVQQHVNFFGDIKGSFENPLVSPLVLDLDGDGAELTSVNGSTAYFDVDIDGFAELTGWVAADDGLLALDVDGDGKIDDGSELFGDQTGHAHGFLALAAHDGNSDDVIDAADAVFASLLVWQDLNGDGVSQPGELRTLTEVGISSISVNATASNYQVAGNDVLWESGFTWSNGTSGTIVDAFFEVDPIRTQVVLPDGFEYDEGVFDLPYLQGAGHLTNSWYSLTVDVALRAQAVALVAQASSGDITGFRVAFDAFVMDWAGVGDVTGLRGNMNGQHLAFLETVFDQPFTQDGGNNPGMFAAEDLGINVQKILDTMAAEFLSQVAVSDALLNSTTAAQFDQVLSSNPLNGFSTDILAAEDTLSALINNVEQGSITIENATATFALWREANALDKTQAIGLLSTTLGPSGPGTFLAHSFFDSVSSLTSDGLIYMFGGAGDDVIMSTGLGAIISGNGGDDILLGAYGSDVYIYRAGDGSDLITDNGWNSNPENYDLLRFTDLDVDDVTFSQNPGGDFVITTPDGAAIVITDHFSNVTYQIEGIDFSLGALLEEPNDFGLDTIGLQEIRDKSVADQVSSGFVRGSQRKENYFHESLDGSYTIFDNGFLNDSAHNDAFTFTDLTTADVQFSQTVDGDLVMSTSAGDVITVTDHFANTDFDLEEISFTDGTLDLQAIRDKSVSDQVPSGFVRGSQFKENYAHSNGDGSYTISDNGYLSSSTHNDIFTFTDLNMSDVSFGGTVDGHLTMSTLAGDVITITDHFDNDNYDIETISFLDGSLGLQGIRDKSVSDQVSGGFVRGTYQKENYAHSEGDGSYTIFDYGWSSASSRNDSLTFSDLTSSEVFFSQNAGGDLVMKTPGGDVITIADHFDNNSYDIEQISFADGVSLGLSSIRAKALVGSGGNDYLVGFTASETMTGGAGDDYVFASDGNDVLFGDDGNDELRGGVGNDTHHGGAGDDEIFAWDGNDILNGDAGDDYLDGGSGDDDSYGGDGNDYILGTGGDDYFDGGNGIDTLDFTYTSSNVTYDLPAGTITFASGFVESFTGFEKVVTGSGDSTVLGDGDDNEFIGGDGDDNLNGGAGNDILNGGNGDDDHYGGDGDDLLIANIGADYFDGGTGVDTLDFTYSNSDATFNLANGTLVFASGFSETFANIENIVTGNGVNNIIGSSADNAINAGGGADTMSGAGGANTFIFEIGSGLDTVTDFEDGVDQIAFASSTLTFGDLSISETGGDTIIDYGTGDQIVLANLSSGLINADDFAFSWV